jgi:uncharacterized membrane protein/thiol-disulfide isomerase/thioredoxin
MRKYLLLGVAMATLLALSLGPISNATAQSADDGVEVKAVLFFSPTCPHCHEVINNLLIPMINQYDNKLQILGIDVTTEAGQTMYQMAIEHYQITPDRMGVPTLVVNDIVLVGSGEIPEKFPGMVKEGLASGGIDWPAIPGLTESLLAQAQQEQTVATSEAAAPATAIAEKEPEAAVMALTEESAPKMESGAVTPPPDPIAISLAGLVLGAMLFALFFAARSLSLNRGQLFQLGDEAAPIVRGWLIPLLCVVGLGVAGYLAYVEITHVEAVCGPIGNCNTVQASPYATLAGAPIAVLGILNYLAIIALWLIIRLTKGQPANLAMLGLLGLTLVGVVFSIYLTVLEVFVIQAVCAWCISSAVITTAIMLIVAAAIRIPLAHFPQQSASA